MPNSLLASSASWTGSPRSDPMVWPDEGLLSSGQEARNDRCFADLAVVAALDEVGDLAVCVGDSFGHLRAAINQANAVVGGVRAGQATRANQRLEERPALRLGIVVDAIGVG